MKRIVVVMAVGVLFTGASGCGGKSKSNTASKSSTTVSTLATDTTGGSGSTAAGATTTTRKGSTPAVTTTANATHTATGGTVPASKKLGPPAPGKYTYDNSGTSSAPGGVPPTSTLTVSPAQGARQQSVNEDSGGSTTMVLEYRDNGLYLVELKTYINALNKTIDFLPSPPVLFAPVPAVKGRTWTVDLASTDGCYTAHADAVIDAVGVAVAVGGASVPTDQVHTPTQLRTTSKAGCMAINLDQDQTIWFSEQYRLSVKTHSHTDGTVALFGTQHVTSDVTSILRSTTPS